MSQETAFLLIKLRDLANNFHALSDAILLLETSPDVNENETQMLLLKKLKVELCETMLLLNDTFDGAVYEWTEELKNSEVE